MNKLIIGGIYRHFKGNEYLVENVATNSETEEDMVIYRALYDDNKLYVREKNMFLSKVDNNKYPNIKQEYRFEYVRKEEKKCNCKNKECRCK